MILNPVSQKKLHNLDVFFDEIKNILNPNILTNKILLTGPKGSGKATLGYHIVNYIFSKNEEFPYNFKKKEIDYQNKSFKLIESGSHPNFFLIDLIKDNQNIEISQIRKMLKFTNKSSFNNLAKFIFIDNLEYLTINSSNALLKIIEEPNKNTFFILIQDSNKKILDTLKSRCLIFKINLSFDNSILITNKLLEENVLDLINNDLINYYDTPGYLVNLINFSKENNLLLKDYNLNEFLLYLINENFFKKDEFIKKNIFKFIELYFYKKLNNSFDKKNVISFYSKFINKINDTKKFNLDEESLFIEFKSKVLYG